MKRRDWRVESRRGEPTTDVSSAAWPLWTYLTRDLFASEYAPAFVVVCELATNAMLPPHAHEFIEILLIGSGTGSHLSARGVDPLRAGTVVVLRPGSWHEFAHIKDMVAATICISPTALRSDLAFLRTRPSTRDLLYVGAQSEPNFGVWVTEIPVETATEALREARRLEEVLTTRPDDPTVALGRLITLLGMIASGITESETHRPNHAAVASVLADLESNPERPWTVTELSASVNLEEGYLTRLFRADVGVPPIAYLARIRAEKAAHLLTVTSIPVSQVGASVGWTDPTYFARRFHALIGMTPSEYRRRAHPPQSTEGSRAPA